MPLPGDLVHQTSSTAGTGAQTLVAVMGRRSFLAAFGAGGTDTFDYYISHRTAAEHERGTGHESGGTLVRDTVLANHLGTTALVNFSAGIKDIFNDVPANQRVLKDFSQVLTNKTIGTPTPVSNANYTILATDAFVYTAAAFTAPRTFTMPSAASYGAGKPLTVADLFGTLTTTNTLTIARAGSDTIHGLTAVVMGQPFQSLTFEGDGVSKWVMVSGMPAALTGDLKLTHRTIADPGWLMWIDGTIGSASSGSSARANADTAALFAHYYNSTTAAETAVLTSAGGATTRGAQGTAAAAYAANCRIYLPWGAGRSLSIAGAGSGLTSRAIAAFAGSETETPTEAKTASHRHDTNSSATDVGTLNEIPYGNNWSDQSNPTFSKYTGGDNPLNILGPSTFVNVMIKL